MLTIKMISNNSQNNKRIAKNTMMLYIRMLLIMAVTLYTSRVVLEVLGVTDFGIYNVVGGVVMLFSFLNGSMSISVQRYLSYELGTGNKTRLNEIFCMSMNIHALISLVVFLLAETVGLYILYHYINVSPERGNVVFWLYQWSVLACCTSFYQIPYNAMIISSERMDVFAYISIIETVLRLAIVYLLTIIAVDKLSLYGFLTFVITVLITISYILYCYAKFKEARFRRYWNKRMFLELLGFASWSAMGELAWVAVNQGVNIVLNIFFGPVVNAARGIAYQVNGALSKFVQSFQTAMNPQIIKMYAAHDLEAMTLLTFRGIRFSYYLLLLFSLPILLNTEYILSLWLKIVPDYTVLFCQLAILNALIDVLSNLFATVVKAYGRIRNYQMIVSFCLILNLPLSYIALDQGLSPEYTFYVYSVLSATLIILRLLLVKRMVNISIRKYLKEVISPVVFVSILSVIVPYFVASQLEHTFLTFTGVSILSMISVSIVVYIIGLSQTERFFIRKKLVAVIKRIK
ncbi:MAG: MATE family efflux transporter [Bacteroidaceae bacterium]